MRDPDRIDRILELLRAAWKRNPDQRLGQLVLNACRGEPRWPDVFNVEDDKLEAGLRRYKFYLDLDERHEAPK